MNEPQTVPLSQGPANHGAPFFCRQRIVDVWDEAQDLVRANEAETGYLSSDMKPEEFTPNPEHYFEMEDRGITRLFTMRHAGILTGYQLFIVSPHFRYPGRFFAMQDTIFVTPPKRGIEVSHFIRFADGELKREGLKILRNFRPTHDLASLFEYHGYEKLEETWVSKD